MTFCNNSIVLNFIMYFKYSLIFLLMFLLIYFFINKEENSNFIKKTIFIIIIILLIYFVLFIFNNVFNIKYKSCFNNSNPVKIGLYKEIKKAYKDKTYLNPNSYIDEIKPYTIMQGIGGVKLNLYNQNSYPLSDYKFSLGDSKDEYTLKKSGNEIVVLSSVLSSLEIGENTNPIEILNVLKENNVSNLDFNNMLNILSNHYDFDYKNINVDQIKGGLSKGGIVIAKVKGNSVGKIFTCTESYIIIYNVNSSDKYKVAISDDRDYNYICPVNTYGFGNIIESNVNDSDYKLESIVKNVELTYLLWR